MMNNNINEIILMKNKVRDCKFTKNKKCWNLKTFYF